MFDTKPVVWSRLDFLFFGCCEKFSFLHSDQRSPKTGENIPSNTTFWLQSTAYDDVAGNSGITHANLCFWPLLHYISSTLACRASVFLFCSKNVKNVFYLCLQFSCCRHFVDVEKLQWKSLGHVLVDVTLITRTRFVLYFLRKITEKSCLQHFPTFN